MLICFARPLCHVVDRLHTAPPPPPPRGLSLGTYNIRYARGSGLAEAIWLVQLGSFNVMLLTKTNITSKEYFHNRIFYDMLCLPEFTTDTEGAQGGVGLVVRERPQGWSVDLIRFHGTKVVS